MWAKRICVLEVSTGVLPMKGSLTLKSTPQPCVGPGILNITWLSIPCHAMYVFFQSERNRHENGGSVEMDQTCCYSCASIAVIAKERWHFPSLGDSSSLSTPSHLFRKCLNHFYLSLSLYTGGLFLASVACLRSTREGILSLIYSVLWGWLCNTCNRINPPKELFPLVPCTAN